MHVKQKFYMHKINVTCTLINNKIEFQIRVYLMHCLIKKGENLIPAQFSIDKFYFILSVSGIDLI